MNTIKKIIYKNYVLIKVLLDKHKNFNKLCVKYNKPKRIYYKDHTLLTEILYMYSEPTQILENIYLGNSMNACNFHELSKLNIGLIVNCSKEISNFYEKDFNYVNIYVYDKDGCDIYPYIDKTIHKINRFIENNKDKNVLIHCFAGASRSATIVIAYLIKYKNFTYERALDFCKEKRIIINLNISFEKQLKKYEKQLNI